MQENWRERLHKDYLSLRDHSKSNLADIVKALTNSSQSIVNPGQLLNEWQEFVSTIYLLERQGELSSSLALLLKKLKILISANRWLECQIISCYETLARLLLKIDSKQLELVHLESGACPYDAQGILNSGQVPQPSLQAEMGVILCLCSHLSNDDRYLKSALKIAEWQKNTLGMNFKPFNGLYAFEGANSYFDLLIHNYYLYDTLAKMTKNSDCIALSVNLKKQIDQQALVLSHLHLLTDFCRHDVELVGSSFVLSSKIEDKHLSLIGHRTENLNVAATLSGAGSGYGCFHGPECSILSFGPQYLPLGECLGYGIKGGTFRAQEGLQQIVSNDQGFVLSGTSLMVSEQEDRSYISEQPGKILLDSHLEYHFDGKKSGELKVDVTFHEIEEKLQDEKLPLAFSFFVKSLNCSIDNRHFVKQRSLNRYIGASQSVSFLGKESLICIRSEQKFEEMNVVPLGGGNSFWGADYLLSFVLPFDQKRFSWTITG